MSSWDDLTSRYKQGVVPESATAMPAPDQQDVWSTLQATHKMPTQTASTPNPDNSAQGMALQKIVLDMPWYEKGAAALGSGFADIGMTAKQLTGKATPKDVDEKRKLDSFLTNDPLSAGLKFAGSYGPAMAIPTGPVGALTAKLAPKLAPVVEGAVQGGAGNFTQPVGTGESRTFNTATGTVLGGVAPGIGAMARGATGGLTPESASLAKLAQEKYKIPLQASDITDSKFLKSLNSIYGDLPITGTLANARKDAKQVAYNRAVGGTFGAEGDRLTTDVAKKAHERISGNFDDIYSRNPADAFSLNAELQSVLQRAAKEGTADQQRIMRNRLDELYSRIDPETGKIDGQFFNRWQSNLRMKAGNDDLLNEFRSAALRAYNNGISGADAQLLTKTRGQYKNFKTVEPVLDKATTGDVSPGLLLGRVASQTNDFSRGGGGDLAEIARIGSRFMVDRTPQTGGSMRALLQQHPLLLGTPTLPLVAPAQWALNNNAVRNQMTNSALGTGFLNTSPTVGLLTDLTKRGATQALPAWALQGGLLSF